MIDTESKVQYKTQDINTCFDNATAIESQDTKSATLEWDGVVGAYYKIKSLERKAGENDGPGKKGKKAESKDSKTLEKERRETVSRVDPMDLSEIGTLTGEMEEWMFARLVQGTVKLSNGPKSSLKLPKKLDYQYPHVIHLDLSW